MLTVFFFQAEDGIRDIGVTGVQTCALPISPYSDVQIDYEALNALPDNAVPSELLTVETDYAIVSDDNEPDLGPRMDNPSEDSIYNESIQI